MHGSARPAARAIFSASLSPRDTAMALVGLAARRVPTEVEEGTSPEVDDHEPVTLEHGEGTVPVGRGVTLYAQWWRPCFSPRAAIAVVHGLKDHSARYGIFAERMVARGFAVHAFDLRGHGRSGGARAWVDAFDDYVNDLDAVVGCVRAREKRVPLFVFGQGMGGTIAAVWALARRRAVGGVILSGAALRAGGMPAEARATRLLSALAPRARIFQVDLRRASRDRGTVEDTLRDGLVHQSPAPARTAKELLDAMEYVDAGAPRLEVPLLAMHGSSDVVTSPDGSRRFVERASSVDKQLYLYDGLAHDLLHEPERVRVVRDAAEWVTERAR
jgi:alpha-beta hydrolase superfamily lysophospholipase